MKRVTFPGRFLNRHVGGNSTYTQSLAKHLRSRGWEVDSLPCKENAPATMVAEWRAASRISEGVLHFSADTGPLRRPRVPSVLTIHGVASRWISTARNPVQEAVWRMRVNRAARSVDRLITVSESSARDVSNIFGIDPSRISVIYHGIEPIDYSLASPVPTERVRDCAGAILYLGNLEPRKNVVEMVRAYRQVASRADVPPLVVAGRPAWNARRIEAALREAQDELGSQIKILGFVSEAEKAWLLKNCSLFLFPSLYEGFGFPVLEALQAGVPVLTSDRGSLAEVAGPALRLSGLSAPAIAEGIRDVLSGGRDITACTTEGPAWASGFTWARSAEEHVKIYEEILR